MKFFLVNVNLFINLDLLNIKVNQVGYTTTSLTRSGIIILVELDFHAVFTTCSAMPIETLLYLDLHTQDFLAQTKPGPMRARSVTRAVSLDKVRLLKGF